MKLRTKKKCKRIYWMVQIAIRMDSLILLNSNIYATTAQGCSFCANPNGTVDTSMPKKVGRFSTGSPPQLYNFNSANQTPRIRWTLIDVLNNPWRIGPIGVFPISTFPFVIDLSCCLNLSIRITNNNSAKRSSPSEIDIKSHLDLST